jgi:hypothetical protein
MVKLKTQLREIRNEIMVHKKLLNSKEISQYEKDTHYDNLICAEAELNGMIIGRDECLKEVLDIFKEDYNSKWTQEFIKRLDRGCLPPEAFDFIKKEIKSELTKLNDGNDGIPPKPKDLGILPTII